MQPVQAPAALRPSATRLYLVAFVVAQVVLAGIALLFSGTQWFLWHDGYPALRNFGYSQRAGHVDCQVLIYGDSSSLTGLDPAIIQRMTGLKTCNVSEGTTVQSVVGTDVPLQAYLRYNPPPRFLLSTWTPSLLRPDIAPYDNYFPEGVLYALNYGDRVDLIKHLVRRPQWIKRFLLWTLQGFVNGWIDGLKGKSRHQIDARAQRDARNGQWPYPLPPETHCVRGDLHLHASDIASWRDSVEAFRRKYESPQTTVIIDVSPVPVCDQLYSVYAERNAGLHDNAFERLPIRFFNEGDVHFSAEGSLYISQQAAQQVLQRMAQSGVANRRTGDQTAP